jgi:glucose-6-phosphate 1-dehydrogenase
MGAYERLLGDAMKGDATLFAREDAVEAEWRIRDLQPIPL